MEPLAREDRPPRPGPAVEIRRLRANTSVTLLCLSCLQGFWTHWNGVRSEPCFAAHARCPGHLRQLPRRWKGYIHAFDLVERVDYFQELTPLAVAAMQRVVGKEMQTRGMRLQLRRGAGDRTRLTCEVIRVKDELAGMPEPRDIFPVLASLWGLIGDGVNPFSTDLPKPEDFH